MQWKKIVLGGVLGAILLTITSLVFGFIISAVAPYNIFDLGGIRAIEDPIMMLFFLSPLVFAILAAVVFDKINRVLQGTTVRKGIQFGVGLFLIAVIPSVFIIATSMTYPVGFHLESILQGIIGYPLLGILFAKLWKV
ncbi:hypothetical protein KKE06_02345 [Candidatus Micrarchaeota archaeon]|nr:hypothetical protein [Candidatus Micrarchaeota archaeon]MBU1930096.1 hypothetical protein [Candidatus Micrarchaeota archaeon]